MGSSILASLSEAGGNDPFLPVDGPLPPHVLVGADRVGTRPTHGHMQVGCPIFSAAVTCWVSVFNDLTRAPAKERDHPEPAWNQFGTTVPNRCGSLVLLPKIVVTFAIWS
jgi:hypothetical protein